MKTFIRIIALILTIVMFAGIFSGCNPKNVQQVIEESMKKGEFFSFFIIQMGLYPLSNSLEEMENSKSYEIEAQTLVDWDILNSDQIKNLDSDITRELVALCCVRTMRFRQTHNIEIKDISKCADAQAIQDAVGMGLFKLENGYFDAKGSVSYSECESIILKVKEIEATSHYEEREFEYEYNEGVYEVDCDEVLYFQWEDEEMQANAQTNEPVAFTAFLDTDSGIYNMNNAEAKLTNKRLANVEVTKSYYEANIDKFYVGAILNLKDLEVKKNSIYNTTEMTIYTPVAIKIENISPTTNGYWISGYESSPIELFASLDNGEICLVPEKTKEGKSKIGYIPEEDGFNITPTDNGIEITFKHTFKVSEDKYSGKSNWMNAEATPSVTVSATIENFKVDADKIGDLLMEQRTTWELTLSYDTVVNVKAESGGLRLTPANNGNGGLKWDPENGFSGNLLANVKNARPTGASAGGSDKIKLATLSIPIGAGFSIGADVYLVIEFDGTIEFEVKTNHSYGVIMVKNGWFEDPRPRFINQSKTTSESNVKFNLGVGVLITPNVKLYTERLIDMSLEIMFNIDASARLFTKDKKNSTQSICLTDEDLKDVPAEFTYCIDTNYSVIFTLDFLSEDCWIGKVLKLFKLDIPEIEAPPLWSRETHFEKDSGFVDSCTAFESKQKELTGDKNDNSIIVVERYKCVLNEGENDTVRLVSVGLSDRAAAMAEWGKGYTVRTLNAEVAIVRYNKSINAIEIIAVGNGSTEIEIEIKEGFWSKKSYLQSISVTVNEGIKV